ncbi:hypothetical protein BN2475_600013 [Paraburkholderia ribeironis]|uniref:Uncharacterized protein n=1 Tax=Paraburkholderia ribeironis TaxID=1247936 RepID=A0A1N7SEQ1_9BURK|nr:hypothetical protein BN2475_600013 [Paraburkholderia ribeironis]
MTLMSVHAIATAAGDSVGVRRIHDPAARFVPLPMLRV